MKLRSILLTSVLIFSPIISVAQSDQTNAVSTKHPRIMDPDRPRYLQLGVGAGFGLGMDSDNPLYNINFAYNRNLSQRLTGKIFGDLNMGTGDEASNFLSFGLGADIYLKEFLTGYGMPYANIDVGYGFARNNASETNDGLAVGGGLGFKFAIARINLDLNVHYSILVDEIQGKNPSVFATRLACLF